MLLNNIRFTTRQLARNRVFTGINILGLSIALLVSIVILQYVAFEYSFDEFHADTDNVYRVSVSYTDLNGNYAEYGGVSNQILPALLNEVPEVVSGTRVLPVASISRHVILSAVDNEEAFEFQNHDLLAVDSGFFDLFSVKLIEGNESQLSNWQNGMLISESISKLFFGEESAVGRVIKLNDKLSFNVLGVFEDWPSNSHIHPKILIQFDFHPNMHFLSDQFHTYIKLDEQSNVQLLQEKLPDFVNKHIREQDADDAKLHLMPFEDIHTEAFFMLNDMAETRNKDTLKLLVLLSVLILMMAWFNHVNLSASRGLQRSKEMAVRRINGATSRAVFNQFFVDGLVTFSLATVIALTTYQLLAADLQSIIGAGSPVYLVQNTSLFSIPVLFLLFGILISGFYPTWLLSSFKNTELIKGKVASSQGAMRFRKVLVVFQYTIVIGLVFGTLAVVNQIRHLREVDTQLDLRRILVLEGPGILSNTKSYDEHINTFKERLKNIAGVTAIGTSNFVPASGIDYKANIRRSEGKGESIHQIKRIFADEAFAEVFGLKTVAGRFFRKADMDADFNTPPIVVNQHFVKELGFNSPEEIIGNHISYWSNPVEVVGVVEDFNLRSPDQPIESVFFHPARDSKYFSIKTEGIEPGNIIKEVKKSWEQAYPGNPFNYFYSEIYYDQQFQTFELLERQLLILTLLSISIAGLGIFAMAFDATRQRVKEIGIRKVLGARASEIMTLFMRSYIPLIIIAALIAVPLVYYFLKDWLNNYANKINIGVGLLTVPTLCATVIVTIIIALQVVKVANINPVESLRQD